MSEEPREPLRRDLVPSIMRHRPAVLGLVPAADALLGDDEEPADAKSLRARRRRPHKPKRETVLAHTLHRAEALRREQVKREVGARAIEERAKRRAVELGLGRTVDLAVQHVGDNERRAR